jgi:MoCo/4Fe-4S cofactor protein with predicted Tat translocation signal
MEITKKYWKSLDELNETKAFLESREEEFPKAMSTEEFLSEEASESSSTNRRDFLKFLGFSVAAATVAACEAPVIKAVPYLNKPENVTPGMPTWYASTYYDGATYTNILVKTREGRPIHIKGNKDFGFTKGNTTPPVIASVLGLYDSSRIQKPSIKGKQSKWSSIDASLKAAIKNSKTVTLLSGSIISPSTSNAIEDFNASLKQQGKALNHIQYDAVSYNAIRKANLENFGSELIPDYDFSKAKTIVSFGADFLATWLFAPQFQHQYGYSRNPDKDWMSKHFQFESNHSITGSNADYRAMIKPSEEQAVLEYILHAFGSVKNQPKLNGEIKKIADKAINSLIETKNESLIVSGSNNKSIQLLVNKLNNKLSSYGTTIFTDKQIHLFKGDDKQTNDLIDSIISGNGSDLIIFQGVNPVYTHPKGKDLAKALKKRKNTVCFSMHMDETASNCEIVCAESHSLEIWNDHNPKTGHYSISQPTIRPLYDTSNFLECLLIWSDKIQQRDGKNSRNGYSYIKNNWTKNLTTNDNWEMAIHNSCINLEDEKESGISEFIDVSVPNSKKGTGSTEVILYQKTGIGSGTQAGNPWLQEMPDPMSKVTWDNYFTMNPYEMKAKGYATTFDQENGLNLATLSVGKNKITLPVYPLPGQAKGTIGVALGYGRGGNGESIGKAAYQTKEYGGYVLGKNNKPKPIGQNVFPLIQNIDGCNQYTTIGTLAKSDEKYLIASTQIHSTVMGRHSIVRETTLDIYKKEKRDAYNPKHTLQKLDKHGNHVEAPVSEFDLWDAHPVENIGHRWGMAIDLNACFGCGACLIACQSENNIPVVGKDEVRRGREMHWMRIDRYFSSDEEAAIGTKKDNFNLSHAEIASLNPKVVHMPMMCQQCNHAPCETVCPVAATTHSNEGLNQMTYNRCIGTRYCANNCPYKVRRFNWFNYPSYKKFTEVNPAQDDIGRMVLNPDVTVRTRGVMEKCSFCVQEIQAAKLVAKKEGRALKDGDVDCACASSCPADAISFGDWNDKNSLVRKDSEDQRSYQALEEVGVKPNVWYKTKVRNEENKDLAKLQKSKHHGASGHHDAKKNKH